jgi:hypothetical protein
VSVFEDFATSVVGLGNTLLDAAEGKGTVSDDALKANYITARVHVAVAEALARQAVLETGDKAVQLVKSAALMIGTAEQQLLDAAAREKADIEAGVKSAFQSAVDLGVAAVKGVHDDVKGFLTFEAGLALLLVAGAIWYANKSDKPSKSDMAKAIMASGG